MKTFSTRSPRHTLRTLVTLGVAAGSLAVTGMATAAPLNIQSGNLTWQVPHEASPYTLAGYATTIGTVGGATGNVTASGSAGGGPITPANTPGAGAKVPFTFPVTGTSGTYDPVTQTGTVNLAGTLTFTAHSSTFLTVVNPTLVFDAPQSIRVVANGEVSPPQSAPAGTPPVNYGTGPARQTVFALNGVNAVRTTNPDGSITISNLIPSGTPAASPTSYLSSNAAFDSIRTFFGIDRANQAFAVTLVPEGTDPDPDPDPVPTGSDQGLDVNGNVGNVLSLSLNSTSTSLGTFLPGVAANHDASVTGTATSTVPSVLYVRDGGANAGHLVNGTNALGSPLKVCATSTASPTCSYSNLGSAAQQLVSLPAGASGSPLTVGLRQSISASEPLSAGTYGKTLTFTLSAGTP